MFGITIAIAIIAYFIYSYYKMYETNANSFSSIVLGGEFINNMKSILFLSMILSLITPILGSLTVAYADDTIIFNYMIFVFFHLIYYDFETISKKPIWDEFPSNQENNNFAKEAKSAANNDREPKASGTTPVVKKAPEIKFKDDMNVFTGNPTSINAIFFASILLSSRLNKNSKVFCLLYISLCIFGFVPVFRHLVRHKQRTIYDIFAFGSSALIGCSVFQWNALFGVLYFGLIVFITFLSPLIFIYVYQFKNDIRGPWDCPQIKQYHTF